MDSSAIPILFFVAIGIGVPIYKLVRANKRRGAFGRIATQLGFSFRPDKDYDVTDRYPTLLPTGRNRYAFNVLRGELDGQPAEVFDFHYEQESRDTDGNTTTQSFEKSYCVLTLPRSFPQLLISKEGFFSKVAQALGFDDIDFESHEFSRRFQVKSKDKKLAYDVCNAQMIEYLLGNTDLSIELEGNVLALVFPSRVAPDQIPHDVARLREVRRHLPQYLFSSAEVA